MMQQGAASVLATLWQVDDQATARLMKHFYAALGRQPADALAALAAAQRRSIAENRGAPDWAAYVLAVQVR
jgi:CHAT domain-containing protein